MPKDNEWEKFEEGKEQIKIKALDETDIQLLKSYGQGPYVAQLKQVEKDTLLTQKLINEKMGIKESDTGLS